LDGAGRAQRFRFVTLPHIRPTLSMVVTLQLIATMRIFSQVYVMTNGGPAGGSLSVIYYVYQMGVVQFLLGLASSVSTLLFLASLIVATVATALCVLFGAMAGYAIARLRFPGRNFVFLLFLASIMVPPEVGVVPLLLAMIKVGWASTYQALILPLIGNVLAVY